MCEIMEIIEGDVAPRDNAHYVTPCPYLQRSGECVAHVGSGYCHYKCPYNRGTYYMHDQTPAVRVTCTAGYKMQVLNII